MDKFESSLMENLDAILSVEIQPEDVDYEVVQTYIPLFTLIDSAKTSIIVVYDMFKQKILYVSDRFFDLFGFTEKVPTEMDHIWYRKRFHSEDAVINEAGTEFLKFILKQPVEKRKDFTLIRDFRIKNEENKFIRIISNEFLLETDRRGNPWLNIKLTDLSPNQNLADPAIAVCRDLVTGDIIFSYEGRKENPGNITNREKQVISMIADGMRSKEIAEKLFISINTVNNHRRNAIEKLNVSTSSEAVKLAIKMRLI